MLVRHEHLGKSVDEHVSRPVSFCMTDKKGGFLALGGVNFTHMQGWFFFDEQAWAPFKLVESISIGKELTGLSNSLSSAERTYKDGCRESFSLLNNSVIYSANGFTGDISVTLDFRHMFDYSTQGRIYSVERVNELLVVKFEKYSDDSLSAKEREHFLAIAGAGEFSKAGTWERRLYQYDASRHARSEFYVYKALSISCNENIELALSHARTLEEACRRARHAFKNRIALVEKLKSYADENFNAGGLELNLAFKALDDLYMLAKPIVEQVGGSGFGESRSIRQAGIFAGLPWFYQYWARDELISVKAFILTGRLIEAKDILSSYATAVSDDGLIPNRLPHSELKSLDAVGWLFVRVDEFLAAASKRKDVDLLVSRKDLNFFKASLERAIQGLTHHCLKDGFLHGNAQESWMDTKQARRSGSFVECQAFLLRMMDLHTRMALALGAKPLFRHDLAEFTSKIKAAYYKQGRLLDTIGGELAGEVARPNTFLAYFIYPQLLSKFEWKKAFNKCLEELWLDWGGLSTISRSSPHFFKEYTGENDSSYHSGDSWFFINNLAALAMHRTDARHFKSKVERILHASREEMLFSGFIGCCAEVSSAKELVSQGCLSQAWSAATLAELELELANNRVRD